jgi:hypothetical protein
MELKELETRLDSLAVFRDFLDDHVISALRNHLKEKSATSYAAFVTALYRANGGNVSAYIKELCLESENVYFRLVGARKNIPSHVAEATQNEIKTLQAICDLVPYDLCKELGSTKTMVFGHDHSNDAVIEFEGITLAYGVKSGFGSYWDYDKIGGTTLTISTDGTTVVEQHYYDLEENGFVIYND